MAPRFRYARDPVFLTALGLYLLNRLVLKPWEGPYGGFFHSWGNDLLCMPFWLPLCLWAYRAIGFRKHDEVPTLFEIGVHLAVWSWYFEWAAPRIGGIYSWTVGDPWDVVAYAAGAVVATAWWRWSPRLAEASRPAVNSEAAG